MTVASGGAAPAVSIIISCYNYEAYVAQAIESALAQTFDDFEVIVVDDGSTDRSADVISRYADRVQSIRRENGGSIKACMTGLAASSGRFILFLDADDVLEPNLLAEVAPYLNDSVSKIQFMLQPIDAQGARIGRPFPKAGDTFSSETLKAEIARQGCYSTPPTSGNTYRRDVYSELGSLEYDYGIDGVAYLLAPFIGDVVFVEKPLGLYRLHGSNMSGAGMMNPARMLRDSDVFAKRLSHLVQMLDARGIDSHAINPSIEFQYRLERLIHGRLARGDRIPLRERGAYLRSILRERRGFDRVVYWLFGAISVFAPRKLALSIVEVRNNPAATPWLRSIVTRR